MGPNLTYSNWKVVFNNEVYSLHTSLHVQNLYKCPFIFKIYKNTPLLHFFFLSYLCISSSSPRLCIFFFISAASIDFSCYFQWNYSSLTIDFISSPTCRKGPSTCIIDVGDVLVLLSNTDTSTPACRCFPVYNNQIN